MKCLTFKHLITSERPIGFTDLILTVTITSDKSQPGSNGIEGVTHHSPFQSSNTLYNLYLSKKYIFTI